MATKKKTFQRTESSTLASCKLGRVMELWVHEVGPEGSSHAENITFDLEPVLSMSEIEAQVCQITSLLEPTRILQHTRSGFSMVLAYRW